MILNKRKKDLYSWDEKFVWNFFLIQDFLSIVKNKKWIMPIVHGYINMLSKIFYSVKEIFRPRISHKENVLDFDWKTLKTLCGSEVPQKRYRS